MLLALTSFLIFDHEIRADDGAEIYKSAVVDVFDSLSYELFIPPEYREGKRSKYPLVIVVHGCKQQGSDIAALTRFNDLASKQNFFVLYPNQSVIRNWDYCWNWFYPGNQKRNRGEARMIMLALRQAMNDWRIDRNRIFIAGLSSGAGMAAILGVCYPDIFGAVSINSGPMYSAAENLFEANQILETGSNKSPNVAGAEAANCFLDALAHPESWDPFPPNKEKLRRAMPTIIFHGKADQRLYPIHANQVSEQFVQTNDVWDDGQDNDSINFSQSRVVNIPSSPKKHAYIKRTLQRGKIMLLESYLVEEMGHKWSGAASSFREGDEQGPDATILSWKFFKQASTKGERP